MLRIIAVLGSTLIVLCAAPVKGGVSDLSSAIERVEPSTVAVYTGVLEADMTNLRDDQLLARQNGVGSGVVVRTDGRRVFIATCHHVVQGADELVIAFRDGRTFPAKVLFTDGYTELALVGATLDHGVVPEAVSMRATDSLKEGEVVFSVGSPYEYAFTKTSGIVSFVGRRDRITPVGDWVQHDCAVNPGNSGGPLFDVNGRLVGINTWIKGDSYRGLSFAISASLAQVLIEQHERTGRVSLGTLGIAAVAKHGRVLVQGDPSAGRQQHLLAGDVITHIDQVGVRSLSDLQRRVINTTPGTVVTLRIDRGGRDLLVERPVKTFAAASAEVSSSRPRPRARAAPIRPVAVLTDMQTHSDPSERLYFLAFSEYGEGSSATGRTWTGHDFSGLFTENGDRKMSVGEVEDHRAGPSWIIGRSNKPIDTYATKMAAVVRLDDTALSQQLGGWNDQGAKAARFDSSGSWYRVYRPTVSKTADGGLFVSFKVDHDRNNLLDDHCQVEMTFDAQGKVVSSRAVMDVDDAQIDSKLVTAASAATSKNPRTLAIAYVTSEVFNSLKRGVDAVTDHGGRRNFPAVVRHAMNHVASSVRVHEK